MNYDLIIFDLDGTLADRDTEEMLPGVALWFGSEREKVPYVAIATNQGGVGLRYWMESGGFGEPEKFPTAEQAYDHVTRVIGKLQDIYDDDAINAFLISFAYQSKKSGRWGPKPSEADYDYLDWLVGEWGHEYRKPAPGMILDLIHQFESFKTLMVGDSEEDRQAALSAGVDFEWADEFFGREEN